MTVLRLESSIPLDSTDQELASAVVQKACRDLVCIEGVIYCVPCDDVPIQSLVGAFQNFTQKSVIGIIVESACVIGNDRLSTWLSRRGVKIL